MMRELPDQVREYLEEIGWEEATLLDSFRRAYYTYYLIEVMPEPHPEGRDRVAERFMLEAAAYDGLVLGEDSEQRFQELKQGRS